MQGPQGLQGVQGTQGTQGLQGPTAAQGAQGTQGLQGNQGVQGRQGLQGPTAAQGAQGTQGLQGNQGVQGRQGLQGPTAAQGAQGTQGLQGNQGVQGRQGLQGPTAAQGAQGTQGLQGLGTQGAQGTQGLQGPTASQGTQGIQGLNGLFAGQGTQGVQGLAGAGGGGNVSGPASASGSQIAYFTSSTTIDTVPTLIYDQPNGYIEVKSKDSFDGGVIKFYSTGNTNYTMFGRKNNGSNVSLWVPNTAGTDGQVLSVINSSTSESQLGWATAATYYNTGNYRIPIYDPDNSKLRFYGPTIDIDNVITTRNFWASNTIGGVDDPYIRVSAPSARTYTQFQRAAGGANTTLYLPTASANTSYGSYLGAIDSQNQLQWMFGLWGDAVRSDTTSADFYYPTWVRDYFNGANNIVYISSSTSKFGYRPSTGTLQVTVLTQTSTIQDKENLRPITNALSTLNQFSTYLYDRKDGSASNVPGLIAEEVANIFPELVTYTSNNIPTGVNYTQFIPLLIEGIKNLTEKVKLLETEINNLKNQ